MRTTRSPVRSMVPWTTPFSAALMAASLTLGVTACASDGGQRHRPNQRPSFIHGDIRSTVYDGVADDLLTAGLGTAGLASAVPPGYADATQPTAAELRRHAIYVNYRALVDTTANGGYGTFYGPNVNAAGNATAGDGKVAGIEVLAFSDRGDGERNVTLMVQLPASFDVRNPCIVTATSSGSRGVYGAISVGEWGLKRGCAVAYTDKGTGTPPHDLASDTVALIDGTRTLASEARRSALFAADFTLNGLAAFNAANPNRQAFKHAHSQRNPEKDWGLFTLQAIEFAFHVINEHHADAMPSGKRQQTFRPDNTLVIASSLSNGGGAALAAVEQDTRGWIDGIAVSEPALQMPKRPVVHVQRGGTLVKTVARPLADFITQANLFQLCATQATRAAGAPALALVPAAIAANRCAALKARGLITGDTLAQLGDDALQKLRDHGWEAEADAVHASHAAFEVASSVAVTYANAYSRAHVKNNLCGFSFAATDPTGVVVPLPLPARQTMFATGNGVPPSAGVTLINNLSVGGPLRSRLSRSPSTQLQDDNLDGALCLRGLLTGDDSTAIAFRFGVDETRRSGNLRGRPALIVHGRADALIPVNHTSRPYTVLNKQVEGRRSQLSYIEVENAQHFDAFNGALPGFDTRFVPLHLYLIRAMDAMWAHLKDGTPLPGSQVVRTVPRGGAPGAAPALVSANVPPLVAVPAAGQAITWSGNLLVVPD